MLKETEEKNSGFTRIIVKFDFEEISFVNEVIKSPTWLEKFIKVGGGRHGISHPHNQHKTHKQS